LLYSQSLYEADRIGILNELSQARADLQKETAQEARPETASEK
jgi:hypothetical protein